MSDKGFFGQFTIGSPSPWIKQLPTAVGTVLALLVLVLVPAVQVTDPVPATIGVAIIALATVAAIALPWRRIPDPWSVAIPIASVLGIGFLRVGTGGPTSVFAALLILPILWIASQEGVRYIFVTAGAIFVALQMPLLYGQTVLGNGQAIRGLYTPFIYFIAAAIINDLAHRARVQVATAQALADERAANLAAAEAQHAELEASQTELREFEAFSRSIWDAVTAQAVIVTDLTGFVIAFNPGAEIMLKVPFADVEFKRYITDFLDIEELRGRMVGYFDEVDPVADRNRFAELVEGARGLYGDNAEWTLVASDGSRIPVQLSGAPQRDDAGKVVGFIFLGTDMTQSKEVSRLKDEFVGMVSHELRTPLSSILGYLELLREDDDAPLTDEQTKYVAVAERNANRLLSLVGDLLFTAQVESGKFPLELSTVDLKAILEASIESARPAAERAGVTLVPLLPDEPLMLSADAMRIGQACDNLISNALKFTRKGGTVKVVLDEESGQAIIAVVDTGMGIPAAEIDRLFTRFFRSSTAVSQAVQGVGLGLSITKAIVAAHRGQMGVKSVEGQGTSFTIALPLPVSKLPTSLEEPTSSPAG